MNTANLKLQAEASVSPEELVRRAKHIAQGLVAKQAEVEARTFYSEETHQALKNAGFYRIFTPKCYGGFEFGIDTFLKVGMELASGCASTGWMWSLGSSHSLQIAALFDKSVQDEVFADPDFIGPSVLRPSGTATKLANGDWQVSGVFPYCSGAPYSRWFMGRAANADGSGMVTFMAPSSTYTRLDDWGGQLGMNGSGSHSLKMDNAVLPARLVFPNLDMMTIDISKGTVGSRLHRNALYAGSTGSFFLGGAAAMLVGIAKNGFGAYEELMQKNTTFGPPMQRTKDAFFQSWYGTACGKVMAAEAIVIKAAEYWMEAAQEQRFSHEFDMQLAGMFREAGDLAWASMSEIMMRTAGTSALLNGARMQRVWRDMSTARTHNAVVFYNEASKGMLTKAHFQVT